MSHIRYIILLFTIVSLPVWASDCAPTPTAFAGSHHAPGAPFKIDISRGLTVKGRILSTQNCRPIAAAIIEHWQANAQGYYDDRLRAYLMSGKDGHYQFETEWPAAPVPHMHFIISAPGHRTLITQWVGERQIDSIDLNLVLQPEAGAQP